MQTDIRKGKLLVISDTALYKDGEQILGFEPVVRELEALQSSFTEIIWLGSRISSRSTALRAPGANNIRMVVMPATSRSRLNALFVLLSYPVFLFYILRYLPGCKYVHTRGPSHPALIGILISFIDRGRIYWHKYAGDWKASTAPATYRLQRKWLKALRYHNIRVTVNGYWKDDPEQVIAFENPCLYERERQTALNAAKGKNFSDGISLLFVGNINTNKGIEQLLEAVSQYQLSPAVTDLYIIGDGPLLASVKDKSALSSKIQVHVLGHLKREEINQYYQKCHFLILPSKSEGFPKVIAEAAAYGCIPVVTDISSISQYISQGTNGYLMENNEAGIIANTLNRIIELGNFEKISNNARLLVEKFTYEHFVERIHAEVFDR